MTDSSPQPIEISETSYPDEPDTGSGRAVKKISSVPSLLQSAITPSPRSGSAKVFLPPTRRADFFLCESVPSDPHFASLTQMYNFKSHPSSEKPKNSLSPRTPLTEPMWFGSAPALVQAPTVDASCSMHSSFPQNERKRCLPECPPDETPVSLPRTPQATRPRRRSSYGITPKPSTRIHSTTPTPVAFPETHSGAASASTIQLKKQTKPTSTPSPAKSAVAQSPRTMPLRMRRRVVAPSISSGCSSLCAPGGARIPLSNSVSDSDATIFAPMSKEKPERHTERPFGNTASGSGDIGVPLRSARAVTAEAPGAQETTPAPTLLATPFAQRSKCASAAPASSARQPGGVVRAVRPVDAITDALWWNQGRDTPCTAILKKPKDEEEETDVETEDEFDEADPMVEPPEQCVEMIPEAEISYLVDVGDTESAMWQEKMQRVEKIGKLELRLDRRWRAESRRSCLRREEKAAIKAFRDLCTTLDDSSQDFIEVPPDDNSDPFIRRYTAPQWEAPKPLAF